MRKEQKFHSVLKYGFMIIDTAVFSTLLLLMIRPFFRASQHPWLFVPIGFGIFGMVLLIRLRKKRTDEREETRANDTQRAIDQLLLLDDETLSGLLGHRHFILIRKEHPERTDVLETIRKKADAIGMLSARNEYDDLTKRYRPQMKVYCIRDLLSVICGQTDPYKRDGGGRKQYEFLRNKYGLLGILLLGASFFLRTKIYFRIISCLCLFFAAVATFFRHRKTCRKFLLFLDKMPY